MIVHYRSISSFPGDEQMDFSCVREEGRYIEHLKQTT